MPSFACTPDLFPDLLAAAIEKRDVEMWAARHGIASRAEPRDPARAEAEWDSEEPGLSRVQRSQLLLRNRRCLALSLAIAVDVLGCLRSVFSRPSGGEKRLGVPGTDQGAVTWDEPIRAAKGCGG